MQALIVFVTTFYFCGILSTPGSDDAEFSQQQINLLAQEVIKHTPERIHYPKDTTFDWVLFVPPKNDAYPEISKAIRSLLKKKYLVYDNHSDIPQKMISYDADDPVGAPIYSGGFKFTVSIRRLDVDNIEVKYSDYIGSLASSNHVVKYRWVKDRWKATWQSPITVS